MANLKVKREATTLDGILTRLTGETIDLRIAKIIFLLDIGDTLDQLKNIIHKAVAQNIVAFDTSDIPVAKYNEYDCRPVPATMAQKKNNEGDCIENLYRHIIAIATQVSNSSYFLNKLPPPLRFESLNRCGLTNVDLHETWAKNLSNVFLSTATENCKIQEHIVAFVRQSQIPCFLLKIDEELKKITDSERKKVANGTIENLTDVIEAIAFYEEDVKKHHLDAAIRLSDALNKITASDNRFEVLLLHPSEIHDICMPPNTNIIIVITEHSTTPALNRTILIAICENQHAEIISIEKR